MDRYNCKFNHRKDNYHEMSGRKKSVSYRRFLWHWKSRDIGGKSALDYLIHVEGMRFIEAVLLLLDQTPAVVHSAPAPKQMPKPKTFALPEAAADNRRVFAYLLHRGIEAVRSRWERRAST